MKDKNKITIVAICIIVLMILYYLFGNLKIQLYFKNRDWLNNAGVNLSTYIENKKYFQDNDMEYIKADFEEIGKKNDNAKQIVEDFENGKYQAP